MTPFTDEQLKRLKELCAEYKRDNIPYGDGLLGREDIEDLLGRLDTAESLAGMAEGPQDYIDAWHKAAGKDGNCRHCGKPYLECKDAYK